MEIFRRNKGDAGEVVDVERILAAARPEPAPLTDAAADRIFRVAMAEAYGQATLRRRAPRRAWSFAAAGAMATLLVAVGGALLWDDAPEKQYVKHPSTTPTRPAVVVAVPPATTGQEKSAAAATVKPEGGRRNARTVRAEPRRTVRPGRTIRRPVLVKAPRALPDGKQPAGAPSGPAEGAVLEDHIARLLVMVDPASAALNVDVEQKDESAPGFARAAAYEPDENGGTVTEVTLTAADGTETALYREGWYAGDGDIDSGTLRVEVTRVTEPEAMDTVEPDPVEPEAKPSVIFETLKDSAGEGVR